MIIKHFRTNQLVFKGKIKDNEGKPVKLVDDDKVYFTVKRLETDKEYLISEVGTIIDKLGGIIQFIIPAYYFKDMEGEYVYDITLIRGGNVYTLIKGTLLILLPVR